MPEKVKPEPNTPPSKVNGGEQPQDELEEEDERLELDCVEESAGDDWEVEEGEEGAMATAKAAVERSSRSLSAPRSPDGAEELVLHAGEEDEFETATGDKPTRAGGGGGPRTPPEIDTEHNVSMDASQEDSGRKRRYSRGNSGTGGSQSPPQSYKVERRRVKREPEERDDVGNYGYRRGEGDDDDEERLRQNRRARLVRLRDARSRQIGYEYVPPLSAIRQFAPQPYFKNPSYYPRDKDHADGSVKRGSPRVQSPPPLAPRLDPLPGGRLPLVQRRSSPPPYESLVSSRYRSPAVVPPIKKRRYIVEEISHVPRRSRTPLSPRVINTRELGPQTLYPSRRNPYPPPRLPERNGRDYDSRRSGGSSSYGSSSSSRYSSSRSGSERNSQYIYTGSRVIPKPFVPPPPPGKKWNCPQRAEPYVPSAERKWRCPKREPPTPPSRR